MREGVVVSAPDLALIAAFVVAYGLISARVRRSVLTGPMVFVAFGLLIGEEGLDIIAIPLDDAGIELLAELTLGLLLFSDAVRIDVARLRREYARPARMLGLGLPLAIGLGTMVAAALFDVPWAVAALVASILAPTDAALGQAVVTNPTVPVRVRQSLNVESGLNDGLALPAVTVFIALAAGEDGLGGAASWVAYAGQQIGFGILVGAATGCVGGLAVAAASRREWMEGTFRQLSVLGIALFAFAAATAVDGNGFLATFSAGLAFGLIARETCPHVEDFTEDLAQLLAMASFIVFGAILMGPSLGELDWRMGLYAVLSLVLVRPLAIALSLIGTGLQWQTVGFFGWFGPRGLASILFSLTALAEAGDADLSTMTIVVSWTVLLSVVAHGLTATAGAEWYGRWWSTASDEAMPEAAPMAEQRPRRGPKPRSTIP